MGVNALYLHGQVNLIRRNIGVGATAGTRTPADRKRNTHLETFGPNLQVHPIFGDGRLFHQSSFVARVIELLFRRLRVTRRAPRSLINPDQEWKQIERLDWRRQKLCMRVKNFKSPLVALPLGKSVHCREHTTTFTHTYTPATDCI